MALATRLIFGLALKAVTLHMTLKFAAYVLVLSQGCKKVMVK